MENSHRAWKKTQRQSNFDITKKTRRRLPAKGMGRWNPSRQICTIRWGRTEEVYPKMKNGIRSKRKGKGERKDGCPMRIKKKEKFSMELKSYRLAMEKRERIETPNELCVRKVVLTEGPRGKF